LGFPAGVIAKLIYRGKQNMGIIVTMLLGIAGSLVASYGGQWLKLYQPGETAGFMGSVLGALVTLFVYSLIKRKAG
jgi:uncharacterized membrane protein YeaQ/YmgE (transglycosylase-associated protein family)